MLLHSKEVVMRSQGQLILALILIVLGVVLLIGNLLDINVWALCFPIALMLLGIWVLFRPRLIDSRSAVRQKLLGDIRRRGSWDVTDEEFWVGVGDIKLDMTEAEIPPGETTIRVWSFVGPVRLSLPEGVGVSVSSTAFVTDARFLGRKREGILTPVRLSSDDYENAERKIRLETTSVVGDIRVERVSRTG
jgi:hypothetical protein